jgi:hypothetical protein
MKIDGGIDNKSIAGETPALPVVRHRCSWWKQPEFLRVILDRIHEIDAKSPAFSQ